MSSPRPGKRPRSGGMEGSTVLVPHNHQAPPAKDSSSSSLIMMLAKSCQKHEEQHNKDGTIENDYDENHVPPLCAKALQTLTRIIPKVEKAYRAAAHPAPMDIQHLCDFYLSVVQRKFCPSALHLFEYGKNPRQTISRVIDLLEHVVSETNRGVFKSQWRQASNTNGEECFPLLDRICHTVASLLSILHGHETPKYVFRDLVDTLFDLTVLYDMAVAQNQTFETVEVLLFTDTLERSKKDNGDTSGQADLFLRLDSLEALTLLMTVLLKVMHQFVSLKKLQEMEVFPHVSNTQSPFDNSGTGFTAFFWSDASDEVTTDMTTILSSVLRSRTNKHGYLTGLLRQGALQVVHAVLLDFKSSGVPDMHFTLSFSTIVVRTAAEIISRCEESKLCDLLAECLEECITAPPRVCGRSMCESQSVIWRVLCPLLLDLVPLLPDASSSVSGRLLSHSILACLRQFFTPCKSLGSLFVSDYPRFVDSDVVESLFRLVGYTKVAQHAVILCSFLLNHVQEAFGCLDLSSVPPRVHELAQQINATEKRLSHEQTGKRTRSSVKMQSNDLVSKRACQEDHGWNDSGGRRLDLVRNCLVDLFLSAIRVSTTIETSSQPTERASLLENITKLSSVVQLAVLCPNLGSNEAFREILERISHCLNGLFVDVAKEDFNSPLRLDTQALAVEIKSSLKNGSLLGQNARYKGLLVWADVLGRPSDEISQDLVQAGSRFPFTPLDGERESQKSRIHLLKQCLRIETEASDDVLHCTAAVLKRASFHHADYLVRLLYWQIASWMIHASTDIERDLRMAGDSQGFNASTIFKFLLSTPFSDPDTRVRSYAARHLGKLLVANPVLKEFIASPTSKGHDGGRENVEDQNRLLHLAEGLEETRLFKDIDNLLHRYCQIPQSQLSSTLGLSYGSNTQDGRVSLEQGLGFQRSAIRSLMSLFEAFIDQAGGIGELTAKNSIVRVIRLWVFFGQNQADEASSFTFGELVSFLSRVGAMSHHKSFLRHVAPAAFRDILFPTSIFFTFTGSSSNPFLNQLEHYCQLLFAFIGKFLCVGDLVEFVTHGGVGVEGIEESLNISLPSTLAQLVMEKDYDILRSLTAFNRYVLHRRRESRKNLRGSISAGDVDMTTGKPSSKSRLWAKSLELQTIDLCTAPDIVGRLLPLLLMHAGPEEDRFFTNDVLLNKLSLPQIFKLSGQLVLKGLILKLGEQNEPPREVLWALKRAAVAKGLSQEEDVSNNVSLSTVHTNDEAVRSWISENFMHLLVNVVQRMWPQKSGSEKVEALRCLRAILSFLQAQGSSHFLPQVMSTVNASLSEPVSTKENDEICLLAVQSLEKMVQLSWEDNLEAIGHNLTSIVVALIPIFSETERAAGLYIRNRVKDRSVSTAVSILKWLTEGERGEKLAPFFKDIPFLPSSPALDPVRSSLADIGLDIDDLRLTMTEGCSSKFSAQSDMASTGSDTNSSGQLAKVKGRLTQRLHTVCSLLSNDNSSVRLNALLHLTSLLQSSRGLFHVLVDAEETSCLTRFLTQTSSRVTGRGQGVISNLVETLLSRCTLETDKSIRVMVAKAFGEVGAIAEGRLQAHGLKAAAAKESDKFLSWRLSHPPWKSHPKEYHEILLTNHLVAALQAAPTAGDHHKIAFTVQEVLLLASSFDANGITLSKTVDTRKSSSSLTMPTWLRAKLKEADVLQVVEPFQHSEFREKETTLPSPPPFFSRARSYFGWMSGWCRYMMYKSSNSANMREWCKLLSACRLAVRSQAGLGIVEFILPILVLERLCNGDAKDERELVTEISDALSYTSLDTNQMTQNERQKAVTTILSTLDTLRSWSDKEIEIRNRGSSNRRGNSETAEVKEDPSVWAPYDSTVRIEELLKAVPLSLQADAASRAGMHARSLRLLEMASRMTVVDAVYNSITQNVGHPTRSIASGTCPAESIDLMKDNFAILGEFETTAALSEENITGGALSKALDGIRQKESSKDWSGALQDYERANHLCKDPSHKEELFQGTLKCMLELGQYESVIRQVKGSSFCAGDTQSNFLVPFAAEAAWRLGRWDSLSELVADEEKKQDNLLTPRNFRLEMGQALLGINQKMPENALESIGRARESIMAPLSTAARESYSRAYPHIVKLHALNEIEESVSIICDQTSESDLSAYANDGGGFWDERLSLVDPAFVIDLAQSRLALARLSGSPELEASLFLAIGKRARKDQHFSLAAGALAQAEASFAFVQNDPSLDRKRSSLILQLAKLKHATGENSAALRLLNMDDIESMAHFDDAFLQEEVQRKVRGMLRKCDNDRFGLDSKNAIDIFRKSALLSTKWMIDGGVKDCGEVMQRFHTILRVSNDWEKGHFQFAKYVESMLQTRIEGKYRKNLGKYTEEVHRLVTLAGDSTCQKFLCMAITHFVEALKLDLKHVFQALPRLLSLWFEFSIVTVDLADKDPFYRSSSQSQGRSSLKSRQVQLLKLLSQSHESIPARAFYSALPQLISRTMDQNTDLCRVIQDILARVLSTFPGQAMWPLAWLRLSKDNKRVEVGEKIFKQAEGIIQASSRSEGKLRLLVASKDLFKHFKELAQYKVDEGKKSISVRPWKGEIPLWEFVPPVQAALSPIYTHIEGDEARDAFPRQIPRMKEFSKNVSVMTSKARPKKLKATAILIQSNPRVKQSKVEHVGEFHFLIKQEVKGDLRKDARVQDLNNVINRLLTASTNAGGPVHHRRLRLRTFTVTCISEDCGVLEWVPNTSSLRSLVAESYNPQASPYSAKRRGRRMANAGDASLRANFEKKCQAMFFEDGDLKKAAKLFEDLMLKNNPPLFFWWFLHNFPDPHQWYEARTLFTLSAAAWSAVGHVIGLGDRHSENILVDTTRGELVHVDFDCIFDKALHLPKPEVVPFRLTPNMLDAFGPVGADGIYAASLKDAMSTLRFHRDTLLSVLDPFVKDPVIDWKRSRTQQKTSLTQQVAEKERNAKRSIQVIEERLRGVYNLTNPNLKKVNRLNKQAGTSCDQTSMYIPLSVDGQVHKMISEATNSENLVQLYAGWMPWV